MKTSAERNTFPASESIPKTFSIEFLSDLFFDNILPSNITSASFGRYATAINAWIGTYRNGTRILLIEISLVFRSFPSILAMPSSSFVAVIGNSHPKIFSFTRMGVIRLQFFEMHRIRIITKDRQKKNQISGYAEPWHLEFLQETDAKLASMGFL